LIAVDTNILVYAHREDSPFHIAAFHRVAELVEGPAGRAIPWPCLHEFLAIVTHPRIYAPPTPLARGLDQVDAWQASPTLTLLAESTTYWPTLRTLLAAGRLAGPRVHDAGSPRCAWTMVCVICGPRTGISAASSASPW
jgi:uncharacterized protein